MTTRLDSYLPALTRVAELYGIYVVRTASPMSDAVRGVIALNPGLSVSEQVRTLAQELASALGVDPARLIPHLDNGGTTT